jgi:hypothetical protein
VFEQGEVLVRRLPRFARPPKHLLGEASSGPYVVVDQKTLSSVVLKDPATGELVDGGSNIPLDQILAGPRLSKIAFALDEESEVRGWGQMLRREGAPPPGRVGLRGVGRRKGWAGLTGGAFVAYQSVRNGPRAKELDVGLVIRKLHADERVLLHPYKGVWRQLRVCHYPRYRTEAGDLSTDPSPRQAEETVRYSALVLQVELLRGGELTYGSARTLSDRGWGLRVEVAEQIAHFRFAGDHVALGRW